MIVKVKHSNALGLVLQWKFGTEKHCISHELQRPQPLQLLSTRLDKSLVRILRLKELRLGKFLSLLLSLDHKNGPKYLKECVP